MEKIGIIMNGVTGRMGTNQHLERSIVSLRGDGGVRLRDGSRMQVDPVLVGRNEEKLRGLAKKYSIERWSTRLEECLADRANQIYFDAQATNLRCESVAKAIAAGKHVYCEKPLTPTVAESLELTAAAKKAGVKCGIVQDKLFLPGLLKLKQVIESGALGRILAVTGDFGYWVFEGYEQPAQRPSWNYRKEDGGGIILDMFPHWQYVLENLLGKVKSVSCLATTHIPERVDETGKKYKATADDAVYATFELENGVLVQLNSSWCTRVNRDDLLILQVDGTNASASAGLRECKVQDRFHTPRAVWNPDAADSKDYRAAWRPVNAETNY
ncbi:MAG TPA: Gfo/Idh/MocA family oxidoreductase, partial [Terriglobales bacterium]|nr:Gfo/Idh/MocA family oxidoreductase [Terriglobales bacterium]